MKVVSAYKPIELFMEFHIVLAREGFDWAEAVRMMAYSVSRNAGLQTFAITDSALDMPHYRYATSETYLMLWVLEISLAYLKSSDFDEDTIFVSPDSLVMKPLAMFDDFDLAITARDPSISNPLMNGLQWWPVASRNKLVAFYEQCLAVARGLPEEEKLWGGDTTPLVRLLGLPVPPGLHERCGLRLRVFPVNTLSTIEAWVMDKRVRAKGQLNPNDSVVVDFKFWNKRHMKEYFALAFPGATP